jgi:hypothetical protein
MTLSSSIQAIGRNSQDFLELEEENLRDSFLLECHEASCRRPEALSKADCRAPDTQTVQLAEQPTAGRIDERSRDNLLRFRDEWVKNRSRNILHAASVSFNPCSEDTASITALNEFYRWRVFGRFEAEQQDEKELEAGMLQSPPGFGNLPKDGAAAGKRHMCGSICREKMRRVFRKTCRHHAKSRA